MISDFFPDFFVGFIKGAYKSRMIVRKIIVNLTIKEPKITNALVASSAFNLKLCHRLNWAM